MFRWLRDCGSALPCSCMAHSPSPLLCMLACSWEHHTEFAVGLDWSMLVDGLLASAGWDEQVAVWHKDQAP